MTCIGGENQTTANAMGYICCVGKLTLLTIVFISGIAFAPLAGAEPLPASQGDCHPNYSGACVPTGYSDVDCASGSGNGPGYVDGPVHVEGDDVLGLDHDGDGVGCEN